MTTGILTVMCLVVVGLVLALLAGTDRGSVELVESTLKELKGNLTSARAQLFDERNHARKERAEYESRIASLTWHIQQMAEKMASLRLAGLTAGGDATYLGPPVEPKPYSEQLSLFLAKIEGNEAAQLVERSIEELRATGMDDEQVYSIIREGGKV